MPPNTDEQSRADIDEQTRAGCRGAGFLAYWNDLGTRQLYVFDRVLHTRADLGQALLNLEMDLAVDVLTIATADDELTRAVELAVTQPEDATTWTEATPATIRSVMGLPESDPGVTSAASSDPQPTCCPITDPCCTTAEAGIIVSPLPEPLFGAGPDELINSAIQNVNCCPSDDDGGGIINPPRINCNGGCCCCPLRGLSSAAAGCCLDSACNDGFFCTIDDKCGGYPGQNCGFFEDWCCGLPRDCDDGNPCTTDQCNEDINDCVNAPRCAPFTCCPSGGGYFCCPAADMFCCPNSDHCCLSGETCCAAGCCQPDETCCNGQCGLEGACCFFDTGSCSELTSVCCAQQGGAYQGNGTTCTPADLCRPKCENCHDVDMTFYECGHFTLNPTEPCAQDTCIKNSLLSTSCDRFPNRLGPAKCNTYSTGVAGEVVQSLYDVAIPLICSTSSPGGFHPWTTLHHGCGTTCSTINYEVRCDTGPCPGSIVRTFFKGIVHNCTGCP